MSSTAAGDEKDTAWTTMMLVLRSFVASPSGGGEPLSGAVASLAPALLASARVGCHGLRGQFDVVQEQLLA